MTNAKKDPLGIQPLPAMGDAQPDFADEARQKRVQAVPPFFKTNFIEHKPQTDVVDQLLNYLKSVQSLIGGPIDGRRLSEHSNAGKSRMIEHLVATAATRRANQGLPPNPYQVICIELDKTTSIAGLFRQVLRIMGDDYWDDPRAKIDELEDRVETFARRLGVEGLVADEVQHLDRKTTNAAQVTDRLKTFLNRGILPLILVGDEDADVFFGKNAKFASRLGTPLQLKPLDVAGDAADRQLFRDFIIRLDDSLVGGRIMDKQSGFGGAGMRTQLAMVSGGHVGRVCRLVCEAAEHALWRGSPMIEHHDLSVATRRFALGLGWVANDPFSKAST